MNAYAQLGSYIMQKSEELARELNESLDKEFVESNLPPDELAELNDWRAKFIGYIAEAVRQNDSSVVWADIKKWARTSGEEAVYRGIELDDALTTLTSWRTVTWNTILEKVDEVGLTAKEAIQISFIIDPIIDKAGQEFSLAYIENFRHYLNKAKSSVMEYSVPVVGLNDDVAILPLIGELDDERAKVLKEVALHKCLELRNSTLIFDLSGVPMVDTMVANELSQVIDSLKLIGVKTILTGLRPEIAQAVVEIGIKFEGMTIRKNLKTAIEGLKI
ncbi:STAS domain-containing protein [Jeotgalibacillus aurantiacus]|uniref:STAS domain-containing protein n=1 Tax=Jeotgalibacillus aurantiacus TaxID=2763266 RepID=UPI001D0A2540|nr:STAS domain-containing protein [Jeotgalibacillus aurantiacus]